MGYSFQLAARVLLYASSHRQDSTYHDLCYTSRGALAGLRNSSMVIKFKLINAIFLLIRAQKLDTVAKHVCLFGGFKVGGFQCHSIIHSSVHYFNKSLMSQTSGSLTIILN